MYSDVIITLYVTAECFHVYIAEAEPQVSIEVLMLRILKEPSPDTLLKVIANGHAEAVADTLMKWPEMVSQLIKCSGISECNNYLYNIGKPKV